MKHHELATALRDNGLVAQVIDLPDEALTEWINALAFQLNAARNVGYLRSRFGNKQGQDLARAASSSYQEVVA